MSAERLSVVRLGQRGEGLAITPEGPVFIPYTVPGDVLLVNRDGGEAHVTSIEIPSADRIAPICPYFGECGGCAVQELAPAPYAEWKRSLVSDALAKTGLVADVAALIDAHGAGRRRATLHARRQASPNVVAEPRVRLGYMRARAHEVIEIARCPILAPELGPALPICKALANRLANLDKPLDLVVTATESGLDIDLRGLGPLSEPTIQALAQVAVELDVARLSNHGNVIVERRTPVLTVGVAKLVPSPGAFLQATASGEQVLAELVLAGVGRARKVADLFCGVGTFALRLAATATVTAIDLEGPAIAALSRAARATPALRPISAEGRDLYRRPLAPAELERFDAVVFDPPRAGAAEQVAALAASKVPLVVAVSCNPVTFARDAATLVGGGYVMGTVTPVDQFRYSPHVEIVATYRRPKARRGRSLFG